QQDVTNSHARGPGVPFIEEAELTVLIDRGPGPAGSRVLDEVVLPGTLYEDAELEGVIVDDLRRVVCPRVNEPCPGARVRAGVDTGQPSDLKVRYLLRVELGPREKEWEIDAVGRALARGAAGRVDVDGPLPVGVPRKGELIDEGRREGADHADGPGAVWPRPERVEAIQVPFERRAEMPGDVGAAEREVVVLSDEVINLERVLAGV